MKPQSATAWLLIAAAGCGSGDTEPFPPNGGAPPLAAPLIGVPGAELFYGAYRDHGAAQPTDYSCGIKAYSGHQGVDILLRNFGTQDSGVTVVAAAAGRVTLVTDGLFDRSTTNGSGGFGNYVLLDHEGGLRTIYGHLRAGSVAVNVGEDVVAGTPLGLVGSSGNSSWPHLHFEVRRGQAAVDPFLGDCNRIQASYWDRQLVYQSGFAVLDAGVSDRANVGFADLLERLPDAERVTEASESVLFWAQASNLAADSIRIDLRPAGGAVQTRVAAGRTTTFSMIFVSARLAVAGALAAGVYQVEFWQKPLSGGPFVLAAARSFTVLPAPAAVRAPRPPASAAVLEVSRSGGDAGR